LAIDPESIAAAGARARHNEFAPSALHLGNGHFRTVEKERDILGGRGPEGEASAAGYHLCSEGHCMGTPHWPLRESDIASDGIAGRRKCLSLNSCFEK